MIAVAKETKNTNSVPSWHKAFLAMLPAIRRHASIAFRSLPPEAREEAIQETICNAMVAYRRLAELGKTDVAYPTVLARYGVAQVRSGRQVGSRLNRDDVLSSYAQRKNRISVERLDRFNQRRGVWKEVLVEDKTATPADIAASRIDVAAWLSTLSDRQGEITAVLATGETTKAAARRFGVTAGRISQLRRELAESWSDFHGREACTHSSIGGGTS